MKGDKARSYVVGVRMHVCVYVGERREERRKRRGEGEQ
jgi:hypothetical protein